MAYPRRLLGADERVEHELRPHWKALVIPFLLVPIIVGVGTYLFTIAGTAAHSAGRWAVFVVAIIVLFRWSLVPYVRWLSTLYVLTNERIITRTGVLSRAGRDIPLSRVNDVSFSSTLFERLLRCGTLTVESAGERGQLALTDVPHVEDVQRELYRLVDEFRRRDDGRPDD